ncbi:MAG: ubiquinol oxidase subunit II [Candidatus Saccharimonadales bacterium]
MNKKLKYLFIFIVFIAFISVSINYLSGVSIPVLQPSGQIATKERNLLLFAVSLSAIVVIPVFVLLFSISWRYRESNTKAKYSPDYDHSAVLESIWWLIPTFLITILSVVTWNSSHDLDPYRPISSSQKAMTIQAVSLDWKWLFIYPDQNIASVNYLKIPDHTPVKFEITSDSVMNSFWIPKLGGQIYSMPGMSTQLHLMADTSGDFYGSSANISGKGFAGMNFIASSGTENDFNSWVSEVRSSPNSLSLNNYSKLAKPSTDNHVVYFSGYDQNLYGSILAKYDTGNPAMMNMGGL